MILKLKNYFIILVIYDLKYKQYLETDFYYNILFLN